MYVVQRTGSVKKLNTKGNVRCQFLQADSGQFFIIWEIHENTKAAWIRNGQT